ncbi:MULTISPECIES: hypothetical protein [Flavobacterium]|uniref:Uncharacterized protein n=1 Tax=Flavobacterium chungangense TaxID=554283 RepID=A0A6V6YY48_9FLAO|nr:MULTISPECIES: hypothetical protein [Flavobacterium]OOV19117.1 hypothetical protein BXU10_05450 [Flavobacterium sp. LM4]CAD0004458.1 hypothetical protein FLACHUCJ7_01871 [Flavobacterium chungangense]
MQKQILHNQSFFDVAIQNIGTPVYAFDIALKNGFSITDDPIPGNIIEVPESELLDTQIVEYFTNKKQIIATGFTNLDSNIIPELGIGTMAINTTFIVS